MKLIYPYIAVIETKEEAVEYIRNQCNFCPRYNGAFECSGATSEKCQQSIKSVVDEFKMVKDV